MTFVVGSIVVLIASILQSSIGFGFALLSIPLFLFIYPAHFSIALTMFLSLITSLIILTKVWHAMDKRFTAQLILGTLIGIPIGNLVFTHINVQWLKIIVSLIILVLTLLLILGFNLPLPRRGASYILGIMAGVLGASVGLPGPPVILYLTARNTNKESFAATNLLLFSFTYAVSLVLLQFSGHFPPNLWNEAWPLIPFIIIGIVIGNIIRNRINHKVFRNLTYIVLILSTCYSLYTAF